MDDSESANLLITLNDEFLAKIIKFKKLLQKVANFQKNNKQFSLTSDTSSLLNTLGYKIITVETIVANALVIARSPKDETDGLLLKIDFLSNNLDTSIDSITSSLEEYMKTGVKIDDLHKKAVLADTYSEALLKSDGGQKILNYNLVPMKLLFSNIEADDDVLPFSRYLAIANNFDLEDPNFLSIVDSIFESVDGIFASNEVDNTYKFCGPSSPRIYSAIIGPSFLGKTQFSFIIARTRPVFYFNFSNSANLQSVYQRFQPLQISLLKYINTDLELFNNRFESHLIFAAADFKLQTIGFIWELIRYSSQFTGDFSKGEWFDYYLTTRNGFFEPLSLKEFYLLMDKFVQGNRNFKIPFVFIDELPENAKTQIKFLRNVVRCLVLPCILSSTNAKVSNMLNLGTESSINMNTKWVNGIIRLLKPNLTSIFKNLIIGRSSISLYNFVCEDEDFKLKGTVDEREIIGLLDNLEIQCNEINRGLLIKIWNFMKSQAFTNLQGTCFYSFFYFANILAELSGTQLDSLSLWQSICSNITTSFQGRKEVAFTTKGRFYSYRMFCKAFKYEGKPVEEEEEHEERELEDEDDEELEEQDEEQERDKNLLDTYETHVLNSVDKHFYYFGDGDEETNFLSFGRSSYGKLLLNNQEYSLRSYYKSFEQDFFTSMALWTAPTSVDCDTIAQIVKVHGEKIVGIPANRDASANDFKCQEVMAYWAAAHSSHQNYFGATNGTDFIKSFVENIQLKVKFSYPKLNCKLALPNNLINFLNALTIPYLVPHEPNEEFKSLLENLCRVGTCSRCSNSKKFDIDFQLYHASDTRPKTCYIECKVTDKPQTPSNIQVYSARARYRKTPLTIFMTYKLDDCFKKVKKIMTTTTSSKKKNKNDILNLAPKTMRNSSRNKSNVDDVGNLNVFNESKKRRIDEFNINAYSIYLNGGSFECNTLFEDESVPDGIYLIIETNFDVSNK